jgi:hypothetical protein
MKDKKGINLKIDEKDKKYRVAIYIRVSTPERTSN